MSLSPSLNKRIIKKPDLVTLSWFKLSFPGSVDRLTDLCDMTFTVLISSLDTTKQILIQLTGKIKTSPEYV